MDDYLTEDEQWERAKAFLVSNGPWIIGGVVIAVIGIAGWRWYGSHQDKLALEAATKYEAVIQAFEKKDRTGGLAQAAQLKEQYPSSPYADQADMLSARVYVESNELDKAAERLKHVMESSNDSELALVARLRLARVQLSQGKANEALATLNKQDLGAFTARFHEARGDVYFGKGDKQNALREYEEARKNAGIQEFDTQLLDLKIKDLSGGTAASREPATASAVESK